MLTTHQLQLFLNREQLKLMLPVFEQRDLLTDSFKLMRKDYAHVKSRVKQIEKKCQTTAADLTECDFIIHNIIHEISRIENKYKDIELATKQYKQYMRGFNRKAGSHPALIDSLNNYGTSLADYLRGQLSAADSCIRHGEDAIRITQRYFDNISSSFASYKKFAQSIRQRNLLLAKRPPQNPPV